MIHEEFVTWKHSELTQKRFSDIQEIIEYIKEQWAVGNFTTEKEEAKQRGIIAGLRMSMEEADD